MKYYRIHGRVVGGKYLGVVKGATKKDAEDAAENLETTHVSFCHACSSDCEDPQVEIAEMDEITKAEYDEEMAQ